MYFIDEIIDFINKNVDSWVLATLILLWIIIFPQYTGFILMVTLSVQVLLNLL